MTSAPAARMRAMVLHAPHEPLRYEEIDRPAAGPGDVVVKVLACGVCRTDLHIVGGELPPHRSPIVPGHEVVGRIAELGADVRGLAIGQRVGIPWLGHTCGHCDFCTAGHENLCDAPAFTGYDRDGGYAEYAAADASYCIPLPDIYSDAEIAPLLCAGLIGYRSYKRAGTAHALGIIGFGAAAHIIAQLAVADGRDVFVFTRPGDTETQAFARRLGCGWAGGTDETPPVSLDAAIIFAPDGALVPLALRLLEKGGRVVCAGIHMSDIPPFPYSTLWGEREIVSVANLTRKDAAEFFARSCGGEVQVSVTTYPLERANEALEDLRAGRLQGAAVLIP